jgi:hypothetical protein
VPYRDRISKVTDAAHAVTLFIYSMSVGSEMAGVNGTSEAGRHTDYRRFATTAEAIGYAVDELRALRSLSARKPRRLRSGHVC